MLRHSILSNTSADVEFSRCGDETGRTGFSNGRWSVPYLCDYESFAIYLDSDMLVFGDIAELFEYRVRHRWVKSVNSSAVSVIACNAFSHMPPGLKPAKYKSMVEYVKGIPEEWNTLDDHHAAEKDWLPGPEVRLLHYTNVPRQPWCEGSTKERAIDRLWLDYETLAARNNRV